MDKSYYQCHLGEESQDFFPFVRLGGVSICNQDGIVLFTIKTPNDLINMKAALSVITTPDEQTLEIM